MTLTFATLENMHTAYKRDKAVTAMSQHTDEYCSANPGDYWFLSPNEPLTDQLGEPMILVSVFPTPTLYVDALTGETL